MGIFRDRVAAIFVETRGIYAGRLSVDVWGIERDARNYPGPFPVVAHPPCQRWGRWWYADGSANPGNDGGCFAAALLAVETFGGVLEHPAYSHAFAAYGLPRPAPDGVWRAGGRAGGRERTRRARALRAPCP